MDNDPTSIDEVLSLASPEKGFLMVFHSYEACVGYLGAPPVLSKFAVLTKEKDGRVKKRTILDAKASGITAGSQKMYRAIYPRAADVINDILELGSAVSEGGTELFVLDLVDAFWQVPLRLSERRFFVG